MREAYRLPGIVAVFATDPDLKLSMKEVCALAGIEKTSHIYMTFQKGVRDGWLEKVNKHELGGPNYFVAGPRIFELQRKIKAYRESTGRM